MTNKHKNFSAVIRKRNQIAKYKKTEKERKKQKEKMKSKQSRPQNKTKQKIGRNQIYHKNLGRGVHVFAA